jgi:competence protein ComEC
LALSSSTASALQTLPARVVAGREWLEQKLARERHQMPLFIPVALGSGIGLWNVLPNSDTWVSALLALLAIAAFGALVGELSGRALLVGGLVAAAGLGMAWWEAERVRAPVLQAPVFAETIVGKVEAVERLPARGRTRLLVRTRDLDAQPMLARISVRGESEGVDVGARVSVRATLSPPPGPVVPGGYHFARRAWFEGIGASGFALGEPEVLAPGPPASGWRARLDAFRADLTALLQDGVGGAEGGVAAALVTGDRGGIPEEATQAMRDSGLAHLIAISGLHIAVVVGGTLWLVRFALVRWEAFALRHDARLWASVAAAGAGIAYTLIAGAGIPTVRACIAVMIVLVGLALGREAISLRLVAAGATLILIWQPHVLISPSFQLSFAAVTGIVALYQAPFARAWRERNPEGGGWTKRLVNGAAALVMTGIAAEAAIAPVALFHFGHVGLYGALANLIAIPLTSFVIIPLLIAGLFASLAGLAEPVFLALSLGIGALLDVARTASALPGAVASISAVTAGAMALIVAGGLWLCLWETQWRLWGLVPVAVGAMLAVTAPRPELFVDPDGRHVALLTEQGLAMSRPRAGSYVREMWGAAAGTRRTLTFDDLAQADCSPDACVLSVPRRGGGDWRLLTTRSRNLIPRPAFEAACAASDIVVSDRRLPYWCAPRWLKLDRTRLGELGAVSIDLDGGRVVSAALGDGAHPWARDAAVRREGERE